MSILWEHEGLREVLADELKHHERQTRVTPEGAQPTCSCGCWNGGTYLHGWGDPEAQRQYLLHIADDLLITLRAEDAGRIEDDELDAWREITGRDIWDEEES